MVSTDSYFEMMNGELKNIKDIEKEFKSQRTKLKTYNGAEITVNHIEYLKTTENLIKLHLHKQSNFIANNLIIYNKMINILLMN